jgi:succinyl-CoA synthetase alpha subunit
MAILIDRESRVVVQGITGREGSFHAERMLAAGTNVVAGTSPGKAGQVVAGVPVFDDCAHAVEYARADVAVVLVPAPFAADAMNEAADAGIKLVVCITEGVPVHDMMRLVAGVERRDVRLVGPNCPGIVSVGRAVPAAGEAGGRLDVCDGREPGCNVGIMPDDIFAPGPVGLISRSGTLTYQIVDELTQAGVGQTTCVGMGGDPVHGVGFVDCLALFERDPETRAVVLIGEIGGGDEERAAEFARAHMTKPLVAYIAGFTAPPGKTMGHAGAIVSGGKGTAAAKAEALTAAGVPVARRPDEVPGLVRTALGL